MSKYLIVVDMQNDFVNGTLGTAEAVSILPAVKEKIDSYKQNGDKIIFTRDTHFENYFYTNEGKHLPVEHCIKNTYGWQIHDALDTKNSEIIDKPSFGYTKWCQYIENSNDLEIELIGLCTDICVVSNALILKALFPEAKIRVDQNACAGVTPSSHFDAINTMKMCQIEIL